MATGEGTTALCDPWPRDVLLHLPKTEKLFLLIISTAPSRCEIRCFGHFKERKGSLSRLLLRD